MKIKFAVTIPFLSRINWNLVISFLIIGLVVFQFTVPYSNRIEVVGKQVVLNYYDPRSHLELARAAAKVGDFKISKRELGYALWLLEEKNPGLSTKDQDFLKTKDLIYTQDKLEEIIREWNEALVEQPQNIEAHIHLALNYYALSKNELAISHLKNALRLDPNNSLVKAVFSLFEKDGIL